MNIDVLGIDLGKNVCSVVGLDGKGEVVFRRRVRRITLAQLVEKLAPCTIGMEACCGAHHLGRQFAALGHTVRLMPPEYVKCYVKAQKNDDRDAEGIAEAATRPTMRFVTLKSEEQLDHPVAPPHERPSRRRTNRSHQSAAGSSFRARLGYSQRPNKAGSMVAGRTAKRARPEPRMQKLVDDLMLELRELDKRIAAFDREFAELSRSDETMLSLLSIPGRRRH